MKTHRMLTVDVRVYEQLQVGDQYGDQILKEPLKVFIYGGAVDVQMATVEFSASRRSARERLHGLIRHAGVKIAHNIADRIGDWLFDTTH